jgi:CDGSH-type Zn-finger protein
MPVKSSVRENGPLRIEGNFGLDDAKGDEFSIPGREFVSLRPSGQSSNKPFCDGTHGRCGFPSAELARVVP